MGSKNARNTNFLALPITLFAPKTIDGASWSYPENFDAIVTPVLEL